MNRRKYGFIIVIILFGALVLFNKKDVTLSTQDQYTIQPISDSGKELSSVIHLNNPNLLSSTIKSIHEDFYINGSLIGSIYNELNQGIPGLKETSFPVAIRFDNDDYQKIIELTSTQGAKTKIHVTGEIVFQNLTGGGKIQVNQTSEL